MARLGTTAFTCCNDEVQLTRMDEAAAPAEAVPAMKSTKAAAAHAPYVYMAITAVTDLKYKKGSSLCHKEVNPRQ